MEKHRVYLLQFIFAGLCLTLAKLLLYPPTERNYTQPVFPEEFRIAQQTWQSISPDRVQRDTALIQQDISQKYHRIIAYQKYVATTGAVVPMNMEIFYVVRTQGAWHTFMDINQFTLPEFPNAKLDRNTSMGTYRLWQQGGRNHLYSCLHKHGPTTITTQQFRQSQYRYDLIWKRLPSWLLLGTQLVEDTCLWVHLYSPEADDSLSEAVSYMEPVWEHVSGWWQNF
jgi:cyanosortase A-associated protein